MSKKNRTGRMKRRPWQPMHEAVPADAEMFEATLGPDAQLWTNDRYSATIHPTSDDGLAGACLLTIRRLDRKPLRDWEHFQHIKSEVCGPEREAVELFPAASRLVDTANQYWLWVLPEGMTFDIGWDFGAVTSDPSGTVTVDGEPIDLDDLDNPVALAVAKGLILGGQCSYHDLERADD